MLATWHYDPATETVSVAHPSYDRPLELTPVKSAKLAAIGYLDEDMLLYIAFPPNNRNPHGTVYEYAGVELDVWEGLVDAESKGQFFGEHIKGSDPRKPIYPYEPVSESGEQQPEAVQAASAPVGEVLTKRDVNTIPELPADDNELKTLALTVQSQAKTLVRFEPNNVIVIASPDDYSKADAMLVRNKQLRKTVWDRLDDPTTKARKAYEAVRQLRDEAVAPYDEAEKMLKQAMLVFRNREAEERRKAEAAEMTRRREVAQREAEERSRQEAQQEAQYAAAQGEHEEAARILANPVPVAPAPVAPVVLQSSVPQTKSTRVEKWTYRIVDETKIPLDHRYYTLDPKKLLAEAKRLKLHANIPGVEVFDEGTIRS